VTDGEKMEGYCSTGQSPQWAVVPVEVEEEEEEEEEEGLEQGGWECCAALWSRVIQDHRKCGPAEAPHSHTQPAFVIQPTGAAPGGRNMN
jgi:hypothetical protein